MVSAPSSTESTLHIDILRKFRSTAQQLKDLIGTSVSPSPPYEGPIPELVLPFPHDILISIDDIGLPKHLRQQMKSKLTEKVLQSQQICTKSYHQTCRELPGSIVTFEYLSSLANTFQKFYDNHQISKFRAKILAVKSTLGTVSEGLQETKRPTFNSEYTPLLERYFEENAYPSRPDRALLAKKSLMTERQIEVWFQNHRNRAKKEGISLRRISSHQSSPMEFLERKTVPSPMPSKRTLSSENIIAIPENHDGIPKAVPSNESFPNPTLPPHIFPTPYQRNPKNSFVDPLPPQEGTSRFPPPNWPRKPVTQTVPPLSINMEEFIAMFASKLSIRRGSGMKSTNTSFKTRAWFSATVTIPSPAPHPALIRIKAVPRPSIPTPLLTTTSSSPNIMTNNFNPSLPSTSQTPANNVSKPRKIAPFPFRAPHKPLPQTIDTSQPAHQPFNSRTSSFSSVSSSQSRSSSTSAGSSPEPTTPPYSPTTDSHATNEPAVQDSTLDTYVDLFAGTVEPQFDFSENLDYYLNNAEIFASKHLPISAHNFLYLDSLFPPT